MITNTFILGITGPTSLVVISIIALIIFGPKKLPQFGRAIGSTWQCVNRKMRIS